MSPAVGQISYYDSTGQRDTFTKPFSEQTALTIDREVRRLIDEAAALASEIIDRERDNIERLADMLIEKETIFAEDMESVLGKSSQQTSKEEIENATVKGATDRGDATDGPQEE